LHLRKNRLPYKWNPKQGTRQSISGKEMPPNSSGYPPSRGSVRVGTSLLYPYCIHALHLLQYVRIIPIAVSTGPTAPPAAPTALRTYLVPITAVRAYLLLYIPMYVLRSVPGKGAFHANGNPKQGIRKTIPGR